MGLIMNTYRESSIPVTHFGGLVYSAERFNFFRQENFYCLNAGGAGYLSSASIPWGDRHPISFVLAMKAGGLASNTRIIGSGSVSSATRTYGVAILANMQASGGISSALVGIGTAILAGISGNGGITGSITPGIAILANITGSGTVSQAIGNLLSQIGATITGEGTINIPHLLGMLNALATLTGQGEVEEGDLTGIGELIAILDGYGLVSPTLTGTGELSSDIKAYGSLTPEGIRDSIWNAVASNYNTSGTMGQKLNSAAVGGVDYDALAEAVWDAEVSANTGSQAGKILDDIKKKANMIPGLY